MEEKFHFSHRLKVRYSEIDGQSIVFNAHYLTYLDVAMSEYLEDGLKLNYQELLAAKKFDFVLVKSTLEYISSARLGDILDIWVRTKSLGRSSFTMAYKITREEDVILLGEIVYVCYDQETRSAVPIPDFFRETIESFEKRKF